MDAAVKSAADEAARTRELAIANEVLRENEREPRLIVDCIPGLVAVFTPSGEVESSTARSSSTSAGTMEELKRFGTGGMTHPEDLPRVVELFSHPMALGEPFEFEVRALRSMASAAGTTCSSTFDERKRAEELLAEKSDSWKWWRAALAPTKRCLRRRGGAHATDVMSPTATSIA
jgi:hypothetical protein